MDTVPNFLTWQ